MVHIEGLSKVFDGYTALADVHMHITKGSIYGLVGVNGAGKTTIIKHLAGVYRADSGTVTIGGQPVFDNEAVKAQVRYIPDELYFFKYANMKALRKFFRNIYPQWDDARYETMTAKLGLDESRRLTKFSKGMQKQAAFVFAMASRPEVLLLDEPIDGLDPVVRKHVLETLINDVAEREMTVLVSSHNLKELDGLCDTVGMLQGGRMSIQRDLDELKSDVHKIQVAFAPDRDVTDIPGLEILHRENRGSINLWVIRGPEDEVAAKVKALQPLVYDRLPLTLEEIFIYEVTRHE